MASKIDIYIHCGCSENKTNCPLGVLEIVSYNDSPWRCFFDGNNSIPWGYNKHDSCKVTARRGNKELKVAVYDKIYVLTDD